MTMRRLFGEVLHHGYVALVLVAFTLILEHHGWINWLDSLSLRVASSVTLGVSKKPRNGQLVDKDRPLTVLIADEMFEREFNQESPLDRAVLADLLGPILGSKPSALAIDLDLSPGPGAGDDSRQLQLDDFLMRSAKGGLNIVVTAPFPVSLDSLILEKYAWMRKLCDAGIDFAFPYLLEMQGTVLRYPAELETLGRVAARGQSGDHYPNALCNVVRRGVEHAAFLSKEFPVDYSSQFDNLAAQRPLNPAFFDDVQAVMVSGQADLAPLDLPGRVIVLGAGFNPNDQFNTAFGPQKGAVLHAATIFSELHPTRVSHTFSILLDLLLGVAAGFVFHAVWHRFHLNQQRSSALGNWPPSHYFAARAWLLVSCLIFLGLVALVTLSSAWLFRHNLWNNPGPMIGGFFVKTLIASRPHAQHAEALEAPKSILHTVMTHLDQLLFLPVVVWAALLVFH